MIFVIDGVLAFKEVVVFQVEEVFRVRVVVVFEEWWCLREGHAKGSGII